MINKETMDMRNIMRINHYPFGQTQGQGMGNPDKFFPPTNLPTQGLKPVSHLQAIWDL